MTAQTPTKSTREARAEAAATTPAWSAPRATGCRSGDQATALHRIAGKVLAAERISVDEALLLHEHADLSLLGYLADQVRQRLHPEPVVTYIVDRNINPTNVCITDCGFCAFYRRPKHAESYVLPKEELFAKIQSVADQDGRQVLIQGGHHPYIGTDWWCELITEMRRRWPDVNPHALSAPELDHLGRIEKRSVREVLGDLCDAGLGSVPGAGAEMLVERVRRIIAPKKSTTDRWLDVHRKIHEAGLRSSATMMFGHVETPAERIEHLDRVRRLQDETGGFTAFICWNMQPDGVPEQEIYPARTTHAVYLRVQAIARIFLDNVASMQTSYVTQGMKVAQASLRFGCNDFGGTMMEENVVSAAGCAHLEGTEVVEHMIERAGFTPRRRNSWYGLVDPRDPRASDDPSRGPLNREAAATHVAAGRAPRSLVARRESEAPLPVPAPHSQGPSTQTPNAEVPS